MVLLFAKTTPDRHSSSSSPKKECHLKRHFSLRVTSKPKFDQSKSFSKNDSIVENNENCNSSGENQKKLINLTSFSSSNDDDSNLTTTSVEKIIMSSTPRHQTACAHRSLPRYYSNNYGKQNIGNNGNGVVYSSTSSSYVGGGGGGGGGGHQACDDSYLLNSGTRKSDNGDSSLMETYELSTDFQQKHVEMLERKYGGRIRARRAAVVVQRAYRKYRLEKKFENLRLVVADSQRRRSNNGKALNRYHTTANSNSILSGVVSGIASAHRSSLGQRFLTPLSQQQQQQQQYHSQFTKTRSDGRIVAAPTTTTTASNLISSQESSADGQQRYAAVGNQQPASLSSTAFANNDNGCCSTKESASRLKLHRYNIGGQRNHHSSAPLTQQLRQIEHQQQIAASPRGSVLHQQNSSSVFVKVTEVDSSSSSNQISESEIEKRQNGNKYRPPAVNILRNRSVSVERTTVLGVGNLSLASSENSNKRREDGKRWRQMETQRSDTDFHYSSSSSSYARSGPSAVTQQHSSTSDNNSGGPRSTPPQQFVSPKSCAALHHFSTSSSSTRSEASNSSPVSTAASTEGQKRSVDSVKKTKHQNSNSLAVASNSSKSRRSETDQQATGPVWLPMVDNGGQKLKLPRTAVSKSESNSDQSVNVNESLSSPPQQQQQPVLNRSLPESQWLRHWGRRSLISVPHRQSELERKRQYRIALNFFNKKPERGVQFLVDFGFVEGTPAAVAKLLISRKGLSKQMIGEYLGNIMNPFNMAVLECFANEVDMSGLDLDVALRRFQSLFRLPGEAQKIERIMEVFARRFCDCNSETMKLFHQTDTIFLLAFAIIMLNTDLHSPNIKPERRMKMEDFMKNLRGIDGGNDVNAKLLTGIYERVREQEFKPGSDHVTQVLKVDRSIVGKKPTLALPHRRLVCYCRLYEVMDAQKKQAANVHQREIFLFNDMILITKILSRKKNAVTYTFRSCHTLVGMQVQPFKNQHYANGLRINHTLENKTFFFNARSEEDRTKFMEDLKESICESDEMEALRIELELEKQNKYCGGSNAAAASGNRSHSLGRGEQRDSGLPELDDPATSSKDASVAAAVGGGCQPKAESASASRARDPRQRCSSVTSLDSGMSSTASTVSRESSPKNSRPLAPPPATSSVGNDSAPSTSSKTDVGGASALAQPQQIRAFVDVRNRNRSGSSTPPPEVTFFTESSEV